VLLDVGGQDSTEAFEDVGHSDEAREILDGLLVGELKRVVRNHFHSYSIVEARHAYGLSKS
jgi:cytochrome b involved in lipid metabolism